MGSLRFPAILVVLLYTTVVQTTEGAIQMGMFPEAADYSFQNCRNEMLHMVTKSGGLLQRELNNNKDFKAMWKDNATSSKTIPGGTLQHMIALESYAEADEEFYKSFNKLVQTSRVQDEFPFKSLFFLLTDAMQLIQKNKNKCRTVHYGTEEEYDTKIGAKVSFESFVPATVKYTEATEAASLSDSTGTVFNITSCSVIRLEDYGCESEEIDMLISPTEVFTVTHLRTVDNSNDKFKEIILTHSGFQSSSNCSSLVSLPKESKESEESSSSFLSSSLLNLMASLLMLYYTLTLY